MTLARLFLIAVIILAAGSARAGDARLAAVFGGAWTLTGPDGAVVTERTWRGEVELLYFGYRFCPDICPTELQTIAEALDLLGPDAARVRPLFITLDPERDSGPALRAYTEQFHSRIVGLTGTPDQIAAVARAYRVAYAKVPAAGGGDYAVDHSTAVYLIDPEGRAAAVLGAEISAAALAAAIRTLLPKP